MSNRRRQDSNPLKRPGGDSQSEWDKAAFGAMQQVDAGMQTIFPISIHDIVPDARQPRRQIPSLVRQSWDGTAETIPTLFGTWANLFAEESNREVKDIEYFIDQVLEEGEISPAEVYAGEVADPKRNWGVIGGSLMAVVNLAAEIRRDGLTNPITVVRVGNHFLIETGERRWLAFHLLNIFFPDSTAWNRIPAREVAASSVWRQASENTARAPLNAISMARQLAILLMDLYGDEDWISFEEVVWPGVSDRAYYAQVADGNRYRIPPGKGEQLVGAMGIKSPDMLRKYRSLLRLPDEIWMLADDLNWEEGFVRTRIIEFSPDELQQIAKARQLAEDVGYRVTDETHTVTPVTVADDEDEPAREETLSDDDGDVDEQPEIQVGDWVKAKTSGDERFQVTEIEEDRYWGTFYHLYNDQMPEGAEMKAQQRDLILVELPGQREAAVIDDDVDENEPPAPHIEPMATFQLQILRAAYKQAEQGATWFSAQNVGAAPETLNRMAAQGLLQLKGETTSNYNTANYRIAPPGCAAINLPAIPRIEQPTRLTRPVSASEALGGTPPETTSTPPVQSDPVGQQQRLERKILAELDLIPKLIASAAGRVRVENITTEDGQHEVKEMLKRALSELRAIKERLPDTKKFA